MSGHWSNRISVVGMMAVLLGLAVADSRAAGQAPAAIQPEATRKIKKATVYLKVTTSEGLAAEGSGFFAMERGIVLTNAHVVGMLLPNAAAPRKIEIVANSGQEGEFALTGQVLGVDRDSDLAVIRVKGDDKRLPPPLTVETDMSSLVELQKVYIFGFPLGAKLGREITASESSISSLRKDVDGGLYQIQVNGGMHPGNSGGPVVDTRGIVVGVAVAGIQGTQINFAVPAEKVQGLVNGRVQDVQLGHRFRAEQEIKLPVKIACLDPLERIREVQLEVWTAPPGPPRPASLKAPPVAPGAKPQTLRLTYQKGQAAQDLVLGSNLPPGQVYWLRPVLVSKAGVKQWGATKTYAPSAAPPLERVAANLTANVAPGERSLKLGTKNTVVLSKGREKFSESTLMNLEVLEVLEPHPKGANLKLVWGKGQFLEDIDGKRAPLSPKAIAAIRNHVHGFACDDKGALISFGFVKFNFKDPVMAADANDMTQIFLSSYQFVSLPLPNREVQPQETWPAKIRLLMGREKKKDVLDVVLTCTYEGTRTVNNRTEALVSLQGEINILKTERPLMRKPSDRVTGTAVFDVERGQISKLNIALSDERDIGGLTLARVFEAELTREAGNTFKIAMPAAKGKAAPPPAGAGKTVLQQEGTLSPTNPKTNKAVQRAFPVELTAGKTYVIDLKQKEGSQIDPYLRLLDPMNKLVAQDDDGGGDLNARIVVTPTVTGTYRIMASTIRPNVTGEFQLTVTEKE